LLRRESVAVRSKTPWSGGVWEEGDEGREREGEGRRRDRRREVERGCMDGLIDNLTS
jgi:hypothetical protein